MTTFTFDDETLSATLRVSLGSSAELRRSVDARQYWIFPVDGSTAVRLSVQRDDDNTDSCRVEAGAGFLVDLLPAGDTASEWMIIDCVRAIAEGRATEFYNFDRTDLPPGVVGASFDGERIRMRSGETEGTFARALPAWKVLPQQEPSSAFQ